MKKLCHEIFCMMNNFVTKIAIRNWNVEKTEKLKLWQHSNGDKTKKKTWEGKKIKTHTVKKVKTKKATKLQNSKSK